MIENIALGQNKIVTMHIESAGESSRSDNVLQELAEAWDYVKKWYNFRNESASKHNPQPSADLLNRNEPNVTKLESFQAKIGFEDLPVLVQIKIFEYLDVHSLSRASLVSRKWYNTANDEILWEKKLEFDSQHWEVIDHLSHPNLYKDTEAEHSSKEIYINCCPECRRKRQKFGFKFHIPKIPFYLGFVTPKVVMFGPGLESDTSSIVKNMFSGVNSQFIVKGMFPGQFDGMGSGVTLQFDKGIINLITLYSASKYEREANLANGIRHNKFLMKRAAAQDAEMGVNDDVDGQLIVTRPLQDLFPSVDAFIYVVDSSMGKERVQLGIEELAAVTSFRFLKCKAPLLVLSCVPDLHTPQYSSLSVANTLGLRELNRPWQVRACHVSSLYGALPGMQWLLHEVINS